jgi:SAM-dependent methyltransferase
VSRRSALGRRNQVERRDESWRPPLFAPPDSSPRSRALAAVRRFLDLQAGSLWRDLAAELPRARGVVLDVGCGAQPYRPLLGPGVTYIGIDTAAAARDFGYERPDVRLFEGDVWPVEDASVDVVLATETLEHVPDPGRFLAEAARCLRPGGELVLSVPFAARWHFVPHDYWRFTPSGLARLLDAAGFGEVRVLARGNAVTVACYKSMALVLPLLLGERASWPSRAAGVALSPLVVALAAIGQASLRGEGGDDCLGYTVLARLRSDAA